MPIPDAMFDFLVDLRANNNRDWFTRNKDRYLRDVKAPALAFIEEFSDSLQDISVHFCAIPKAVGGSLFRIYRDTRFSMDKTPYKTHTAMHFRHRQSQRDVHMPGFYLHIEPGASHVAAGVWRAANRGLVGIRDRISADPERWSEVKAALATTHLEFISGGELKGVPRGYDPAHRHGPDLRRKTLAVIRPVPDALITSPDFSDQLAGHFDDAAPLVRFLCESLRLPF